MQDDSSAANSQAGGTPSTDAGGSGSANAKMQGNQGSSARDKGAGSPQAGTQAGQPVSSTDDGGASSPLVPILIVMAALAAISGAVVMLRSRRHPGKPGSSSASPEAS